MKKGSLQYVATVEALNTLRYDNRQSPCWVRDIFLDGVCSYPAGKYGGYADDLESAKATAEEAFLETIGEGDG